ncbi:WSC domain-containing protein 2-like isoform X1 [Acanthaster planci]|uniref:WSC domain-containing protein 2-like isoform X1 n=1 Tax=Acanthaster planci TaxID=133434 RepID=A0A8B7Y6Z0_ACAPL|nr:WSC domain-containing protein 2-like isoform X1 [Acanthaster planci]
MSTLSRRCCSVRITRTRTTLFLLVLGCCACYIYGRLFFGGTELTQGGAVSRNAGRKDVGESAAGEAAEGVLVMVHKLAFGGVELGARQSQDFIEAGGKSALRLRREYVSALNKTWMTWTDINSPGVYRACVPRPRDSVSMSEVVTGGLVEKSSMMTITHCLNSCIALGFTYAALSRGAECFCTDVKGESALLSYKDSALCDIPCGGEPRYHCGGRDYMSLYRTSVPDSRCSRIKLKPKGSMPLIALASYPRSGNTWTRQLIERGTGFLTGSVHWKHEKEMAISSKIFPGGNIDYQTRQTVCVKSHLSDTAHIKTFEGAILLIRNPYSALVAEIFRRLMLDQEKSAEETVKYFDSPEWRHFAENQAQSWRNMAVQWITNSHRILVSHYENLQENTYEELAKIVRFLDVPVQTQRILCAIQEYPSSKATGVSLGNHGRKTRVYLTKDPFPPDVRKLVDENIKQVNTTLIEYKLNPLPRDYSVDVF